MTSNRDNYPRFIWEYADSLYGVYVSAQKQGRLKTQRDAAVGSSDWMAVNVVKRIDDVDSVEVNRERQEANDHLADSQIKYMQKVRDAETGKEGTV